MIVTNLIFHILSASATYPSHVLPSCSVCMSLDIGSQLSSISITDFSYEQLMNITLTVRSHVCMRTRNIHIISISMLHVLVYAQIAARLPTINCR